MHGPETKKGCSVVVHKYYLKEHPSFLIRQPPTDIILLTSLSTRIVGYGADFLEKDAGLN